METPSSFQTSIKYLNFRAKIFQLLNLCLKNSQFCLHLSLDMTLRLKGRRLNVCVKQIMNGSNLQNFMSLLSRSSFFTIHALPSYCSRFFLTGPRIYRIQSQEQTQGATNHQHKAPKLKPKPIEDQINFQHLMMVAHIFYPKRIL